MSGNSGLMMRVRQVRAEAKTQRAVVSAQSAELTHRGGTVEVAGNEGVVEGMEGGVVGEDKDEREEEAVNWNRTVNRIQKPWGVMALAVAARARAPRYLDTQLNPRCDPAFPFLCKLAGAAGYETWSKCWREWPCRAAPVSRSSYEIFHNSGMRAWSCLVSSPPDLALGDFMALAVEIVAGHDLSHLGTIKEIASACRRRVYVFPAYDCTAQRHIDKRYCFVGQDDEHEPTEAETLTLDQVERLLVVSARDEIACRKAAAREVPLSAVEQDQAEESRRIAGRYSIPLSGHCSPGLELPPPWDGGRVALRCTACGGEIHEWQGEGHFVSFQCSGCGKRLIIGSGVIHMVVARDGTRNRVPCHYCGEVLTDAIGAASERLLEGFGPHKGAEKLGVACRECRRLWLDEGSVREQRKGVGTRQDRRIVAAEVT